MTLKPTLIGCIGAVAGSTISVRQSPSIASGIAIIGGKSYRVAQVGSFVRIPQGYHNLYGIVSEVGANATPKAIQDTNDRGERWVTVQLVGEMVGDAFERGISQYPSVNDEVHLVTEEDLSRIYGNLTAGQIIIGKLANAENVPISIDLDKLITRHSAVLGSTGSGKSTTVASLLRSISLGKGEHKFPNARILLLDIHGEYGRALKDVATVFRVNPNQGEKPLCIPFWALEPADLLAFLMGKIEDKPLTQILDRILEHKMKLAEQEGIDGVDITSMTADSPIPYSLKTLWSELIEPEIKTWDDQQRTTPALIEAGDPSTLRPPKYKMHGPSNTPPFINQVGVLGIRRQLDQMRSRLLDKQYDFLLHPGSWEPDLNGKVKRELPELLATWLGDDRKPITILDLSGIPSAVLMRLIGAILKIIYESLFWGREKTEGGISRPLLIVMEEAHRYLGRENDSPARNIVQRIVKEGRKFGMGAMIISQRPTEVDETILSQCGTFIALRLSNSADRNKVQSTLPDNLMGIVDTLSVLRTGEAIITGEAARLPIRCRITLPSEEHRPNSEDPKVAKNWQNSRLPENYGRVAASWRSQNPRWTGFYLIKKRLSEEEIAKMEREMVQSSTIVSVGYDSSSQTLEIEFKSGGTYQYYNVPDAIHTQFMESDSKGKFHHTYIKNSYPCSRI